jgi:hypothetical protein
LLLKTQAGLARPAADVARWIGMIVLGISLAYIAFAQAHIDGDGTEYVMMAHGFVNHASPELKPADIADVMAMPEDFVLKSNLDKARLAAVPQAIGHDGNMPLGFAGSKSHGIQAIHFWMYSLLAAPLYALTLIFGQNPVLAFVALNCLVLAATATTILRWYPRAGLPEVAFLALLGAVLYLRWTGPEVFSACCALLAMLAMLRRDLALSVALAGFGATQNPSLAGLILAAGAYRILLAQRPAWAFGPVAARKHTLRDRLLVVAGIVLAALPYAYNELVFGVPSIIAAHFTDTNQVSMNRFHSFFLDLNQGMVAGMPGLALALVLLPAVLGKGARVRWSMYAAGAALLTVGLSLPALATVNWNSGAIVMLRYAYWTAMPLVAVCIAGLVRLTPSRRWIVVGAVALCQAYAMWQAYWPESDYLRHSKLAGWVLDHVPGLYNPDPEIFVEREQHKERGLSKDLVVVHRGAAGPTKLMRYWANAADTAGVCPAGQSLVSTSIPTQSGWEYFNAPFDCTPGAKAGAYWLFDTAHPEQAALLKEGWSHLEGNGVWSEGGQSVLDITLPPGHVFRRLGLIGSYLQFSTRTGITINGIDLGQISLGAAPIALPPSLGRAASLHIELHHAHPISPAALGMSADTRQLAFHLQSIYLDDGAANRK